MKKKSIPETSGKATPDYVRAVKDNIDVITGRRGNKLNLPDLQMLSCSTPPTRAQCLALNAYVNEWGKSLAALVERLDETPLKAAPVAPDNFVAGTVSALEGSDSSAAAGIVKITGTIAKTNANDTASASGAVKVTGTIARTNANDASAASGTVTVSGSAAGTNANDTAAAVGNTDVVSLTTPVTVSDTVVTPGTANAAYELNSSGDVFRKDPSPVDIGDWVVPKTSAPSYECFATLNSGTLTSGTTGAWLALTTTRTWTKSKTGLGTTTAQITVQIRQVGTTTILATAVVTLTATVDPGG